MKILLLSLGMRKKERLPLKSNANSQWVPQLTLDCIILGFHQGQLRVLLLRWKGTQEWSLPGGPVRQEESIEVAAARVLKERTCLEQIYLKQFHVFGDLDRYKKSEVQDKLRHIIPPDVWYDRAISVGYYALVDYSKVSPTPDVYTDECRWWDIHEVPPLLFDHNHMISLALKALRMELNWQPVGYNLLPEQFTMPELQRLYETILGKPLDARNFYKKMLGLGILDRLKERRRGGAYKAPYLYRFKKEDYEAKLKEGHLSFL